MAVRANKKITCPYCFHVTKANALPFRCTTVGCRYEQLRIMFDFMRKGTSVEPWSFCERCWNPTTQQVCPACRRDLPPGFLTSENKSIAIVGGRGAGKSHYLASLFRQLEHERSINPSVSLSPYDHATQDRFERNFLGPLKHHSLIPATRPVSTEAETKNPLQFVLRTRASGIFRESERTTYMMFFDTAGEDLTSFDTMTTELQYISSADGIIFVLDPLQIPEVRRLCSQFVQRMPRVDVSANPAYIVDRVRDLFDQTGQLQQQSKIGVPVAFALSKVDTLFPWIDPSSTMRQPSNHGKSVNLREIESVNTEIMSCLGTWDPNFATRIDQTFTTYRTFGVSALGQPPSDNGRVETLAPFRVEDPLLWLLSQFGMIDAGRSRRAA